MTMPRNCLRCESKFKPSGKDKYCQCCRKTIRLEGIQNRKRAGKTRVSIFELCPSLRKTVKTNLTYTAGFYQYQ